MKKRNILILLMWIVFLQLKGGVVCAEYGADTVVAMQIHNPIMQINGQNTEIDQGRDTVPLILNGRTLVPIRAIVEAFGGEVHWDAKSKTVFLAKENDLIKLTIDSSVAYLNEQMYVLDVAPTIVDDRTMLPIRFVAEGFRLGVGWDGRNQTVYIVENGLDSVEQERLMREIPQYKGKPIAEINENVPYFEVYERIAGSFEYYSDLDKRGRCNVCMASVGTDIMPIKSREDIKTVTPTGWQSVTYGNISGGYLYNRCHLLGFQLTGENAEKRNLITGTSYMNVIGMLPYENQIAEYVKATGNHVMYRVTPMFTETNLVADGVLLEAYSVEDNGAGIMFCVYCYNVQPGIQINYADGTSTRIQPATGIYKTPTGKRYHSDRNCGGVNSFEVTWEQVEADELTPCKKCCE